MIQQSNWRTLTTKETPEIERMPAPAPAKINAPRTGQRGFTLIELVVVIIVLGILAAVVMMGGTPISSSRRVNADALKSAIRYAQGRAMKTGNTWGVSWDATNYWAFKVENTGTITTSLIPGESTSLVNYTNRNVSLATNPPIASPVVIAFNVAGQPFTDTALTTPLAANTTVTMTATDDTNVTQAFIITAETGYLQ